MSSDTKTSGGSIERTRELLAAAVNDRFVELSADDLQQILAAAIRLFVARIERGEGVPPFPSAESGRAPTATDIMVFAGEILAAAEIEVFELAMWQTWGSVRAGAPANGSEAPDAG